MAPRANWKGYLKLSLVSCKVALYPATTTRERVRFNIINRETGHRVHNQIVDAETGDPVEDEDRVKGYKLDRGRYVLLEEDELDKVALESTHTIDIEAFVPRTEIDPIYFDRSYFIAPDDKVSAEAFAVIREAMEKKGLAGLARVVLYRREHVLMIEPRGKGLVATTLHFHNEVRDADTYFDDIPTVKTKRDMLDLAAHILESKKTHFDPSAFEDRYEKALVAVIKAKKAGKEPPKAAEAPRDNVINLMDALKRSVQTERRGSSRGRTARPRTTRVRKSSRPKTAKRRMKKAS